MEIIRLLGLIQYLHFMGTKFRISYILVVLFAGFITINATCNKSGFDCSIVTNYFDLPAKIYPDHEMLPISDSLTILIDESIIFRDVVTGQSVKFDNAGNLGSTISFQRYDSTNSMWEQAANNFHFSLIKGKSSDPIIVELNRDYLFYENNKRYQFHLIIKPQRTGLYKLIMSNSINTFRKSDPCEKANFNIYLKETNHNKHLISSTGEDQPGGYFYFVVK